MSAAPTDDAARRAAFLPQLRSVGASICATDDIDDIMLNLSAGICELFGADRLSICLLYTSPSPRDRQKSRMPSSA